MDQKTESPSQAPESAQPTPDATAEAAPAKTPSPSIAEAAEKVKSQQGSPVTDSSYSWQNPKTPTDSSATMKIVMIVIAGLAVCAGLSYLLAFL